MKRLLLVAAVLLAACSAEEPERYTATVDVDMNSVEAMLTAIDRVTDNELDIAALIAMTETVPMDDEKQVDLAVTMNGIDAELFYHVWREQADWVHIYASSTSKPLVDAVQAAIDPFARQATE